MTNGEKFMEVFGVGCATYDVMHDITTIHRNGDWWDAEYEGEEEDAFKQKAGVVIEQLRADRDRLEKALEEIRAEVEQITNTMGVSYYPYVSKIDVLQIIDKHRKEEE